MRITTGLPSIACTTLRVGLVVLFFGRLDLGAQVQELGAVQADAVAAALDAVLHFVRELDVAEQLDAHAVGRFGRQVAQRLELRGPRPLLFDLVAVAGDRLFVGLQDHQPLVAVDDHQVAAGDVGQERAGADDGRNFQPFGDDRRVAAGPADLGDEAAHEAGGRDWPFRWA